jgi:hypothetical protein
MSLSQGLKVEKRVKTEAQAGIRLPSYKYLLTLHIDQGPAFERTVKDKFKTIFKMYI